MSDVREAALQDGTGELAGAPPARSAAGADVPAIAVVLADVAAPDDTTGRAGLAPTRSARAVWRESVIHTALVFVLALAVSLFAMSRMDFLGGAHPEYVRMTDSARNAYVAKNLVNGRGYSANEIPASLVGFYAQHGKLELPAWPNADRFPFTTIAIASLYTITGIDDWWMGIAVYNIIAFSILITLIYRLSIKIFGNHYSGVLAVVVALANHGTYYFLYQKDADSVALTVGVVLALITWLETPHGRRWRRAGPVLGTLLAWLFLARPNVGMPLVVYLVAAFVIELWRREPGRPLLAEARRLLSGYAMAGAVFVVWIAPYAIYSWRTWGSPFFSANSLYQLPLGTRLSLGGDTWWKYFTPDRVLGFSKIVREVPGEIVWKVVTSWVLTARLVLSSFAAEIIVLVAARLTIWRGGEAARAGGADPVPRASVRTVGRLLIAVVVFNLLSLPLFGWAYFPWKQYLTFGMPWVWVFVGHVLYRFGSSRQVLYRFVQRVRAQIGREPGTGFFWLVLAILLGFLTAWRGAAFDGTFVTPRLTDWVWRNWLVFVAVIVGIFVVRRLAWTPVTACVAAFAGVVLIYKPSIALKSDSVNYYPLSGGAAKTLRERSGLVSSLALQSEVAWLSDRRNIPVPENVMLLYRYPADFKLAVEDIYIESAGAMVSPPVGPFQHFMPGLEGYARLERYQAPLPGYTIAFHEDGEMGYPRYKVAPRDKASTIYRLVDPSARDGVWASPTALALGDAANAMYLAHGFGGYFEIDGRRVVAQTNVTRLRYPKASDPQPWEDASVTFFLRARMPTQVTLALYVPADVKVQFYWNLDLDAYDRTSDRKRHALGERALVRGWQTVTLDVPAGLPRDGLNKLGMRPAKYIESDACPMASEPCQAKAAETVPHLPDGKLHPTFMAVYGIDSGTLKVAQFVESLTFTYAR